MDEIPPFRLVPEPLTAEAAAVRGFRWAGVEAGQRHRLGVKPDGLEEGSYPTCPACQQRMTFYGQLDSLDDDYCIADVGLVLVFLCFDCFTARAVVASS